jgi:hypothetical protein
MAILDFENINLEKRLGFKLDPATGYIAKAILENITLEEKETKEVNANGKVSTSEFVGCNIPVLKLDFKQIPTEKSEMGRERYFTHRLNPVSLSGDMTEEGRINMYIEQVRLLHNLTNQYTKEKGFTFDRIKPKGIDTETLEKHIKSVTEIYNYYFKAMSSIPYNKVIIWMKLVAEYSKGTYYTFPTYVGEGIFDRFQEGIKTYLEIKPSESVKLISRNNKNNNTNQTATNNNDEQELKALLNGLEV